MSDQLVPSVADYQLPPSIVTRRDVSRLSSELEQIDNDITAAAVRDKIGVAATSQLQYSQPMNDFLQLNSITLATGHERSALIVQLRQLKDIVPVVHMTFSTEADHDSLQQLAQWIRTSIHPQAVIEVGLQPSLIAGVYLRTPNKVHDLSMRSALQRGRQVLTKELEQLYAGR